jgi:hypothetical protein
VPGATAGITETHGVIAEGQECSYFLFPDCLFPQTWS